MCTRYIARQILSIDWRTDYIAWRIGYILRRIGYVGVAIELFWDCLRGAGCSRLWLRAVARETKDGVACDWLDLDLGNPGLRDLTSRDLGYPGLLETESRTARQLRLSICR